VNDFYVKYDKYEKTILMHFLISLDYTLESVCESKEGNLPDLTWNDKTWLKKT